MNSKTKYKIVIYWSKEDKLFIAPPGYYMLFALRDKSQSESGDNRIPSIAKIVKLEI